MNRADLKTALLLKASEFRALTGSPKSEYPKLYWLALCGEWIDALVVRDIKSVTSAADLYASFARWCAGEGEPVPSRILMGRGMRIAGYFPQQGQTGYVYRGIRVADPCISDI